MNPFKHSFCSATLALLGLGFAPAGLADENVIPDTAEPPIAKPSSSNSTSSSIL